MIGSVEGFLFCLSNSQQVETEELGHHVRPAVDRTRMALRVDAYFMSEENSNNSFERQRDALHM